MDIRYNITQLIARVQTFNLLQVATVDYNKGFSTCRFRVNKRLVLTVT